MEMTGEITAYVENKRMRVTMIGDMFELDVDYILNSLSDNQTEVTQESQISFKGLIKLLSLIHISEPTRPY